jgi:hypothetical protein
MGSSLVDARLLCRPLDHKDSVHIVSTHFQFSGHALAQSPQVDVLILIYPPCSFQERSLFAYLHSIVFRRRPEPSIAPHLKYSAYIHGSERIVANEVG